jgi:hypothetical protein
MLPMAQGSRKFEPAGKKGGVDCSVENPCFPQPPKGVGQHSPGSRQRTLGSEKIKIYANTNGVVQGWTPLVQLRWSWVYWRVLAFLANTSGLLPVTTDLRKPGAFMAQGAAPGSG